MHKYITVAYSLYTDNAEGVHELVEQAPVEHPFQFITELGVALEAFEAKRLSVLPETLRRFVFIAPTTLPD